LLIHKIVTATVLAFAAAASAAPLYAPVGPQLNVALSTVTSGGWTQCYAAPMSTFLGSSAAAALGACSGNLVLLAGRQTGSDTLLALAQAPKVDALFDTGINNRVTHVANGTQWYNADDWSWGFAPAGEPVFKDECDNVEGSGRICLHTIRGVGGYRINDLITFSASYEKLVFTSSASITAAVPEPAAWALMIGGFGMIGAALRRRVALAA